MLLVIKLITSSSILFHFIEQKLLISKTTKSLEEHNKPSLSVSAVLILTAPTHT